MLRSATSGAAAVVVRAAAAAAGRAPTADIRICGKAFQHRWESSSTAVGGRERLVVLGSGWGAASLLQAIDPTKYDLTVISPRNYFMMTALLPGVTVGTVEARSIIEPIRRLLPGTSPRDSRFYEAAAVAVDPEAKTVTCRDLTSLISQNPEFTVPYDHLVVSVGAPFDTKRVPGAEEHALKLKEVEDARRVRGRLVDMLETAALPGASDGERAIMCAVVVVGGGPIGVAVASEIDDFLTQDVPRVYPELQDLPSVTIVHAADHILNVYDERISSFAERKLKKDKVKVLTGREVLEVRPGELLTRIRRHSPSSSSPPSADDKPTKAEVERHPFGLCVWTTGLGTAPLTRDLQMSLGQGGQRRALAVDEFLRVRGAKGIFALGDCADVKEGTALADAGLKLFAQADTDNSGTIDADELRQLLSKLQGSHPHVRPLLEGDETVTAGLFAASGISTLGQAEFQAALEAIDLRAKSHPSTAQVASQQGAYLAKSLNNGIDSAEPFKYKHLGAFVQLGGSQAAMQMPGDMVWTGFSTMALWYGAYFSEQVSWRNRWLVLSDWLRVRCFGRDNSRI